MSAGGQNINRSFLPWLLLCQVLAMSCKEHNSAVTLFSKLDAGTSGIHFSNTVTENDSVNLVVDEYAYMGSGVGVGDFNNDGLPDLFFGASQGSSGLYLNLGNHHFRDITQSAGLETTSWCTGISVVDINNDGYADIYVCVSGNVPGERRKNLLFINQHNLTFTENASEYGLADTGYSTQAAFFDFDKDGRLDMYLVNHELHPAVSQNDIVRPDNSGLSIRSDKLYKNMGILAGTNHPYFKDVSSSAGIKDDGYGLGVAISDLNGDGWPDIYVTNDYISNDLLWLNNRNGTFTNVIAESLGHQGYSSMGVDAADINNDGLPDIATLDMMPEDNYRKKMMFSFMNYGRYETERRAGYQPEFMRNMLQLNRGVRKKADTAMPYFSEIGQLAGMSETDWSWSVLLVDLDNDGYKDISITNGIGRDLINSDFINYRSETYGTMDKQARDRLLRGELDNMGKIALRNYYFHNNGDGSFSNQSEFSGINEKTISNGAAYVDLDNDGDLDLVVNNIDQEASIYINNSRGGGDTSSHFINFILRGDNLNREGFGAKIQFWQRDLVQTVEQYPVRGYASSVDTRVHFGLGKSRRADSVVVTWANGKQQCLKNPPIDTTLVLNENEAVINHSGDAPLSSLFIDITDSLQVYFKHQESFFNDFAFNPLLPQKFSQAGPFISTGDMNGDGLADFFIGGAFSQSGEVCLQQKNGSFQHKALVKGPKYEEDMQSILVDVDGDHDPDLIVAGGSTEFDKGSPYHTPRLYLNDGKGIFTLSRQAFPPSINTMAQSISYTGGGRTPLHVFIGGRVSLEYPYSPKSFLLEYRNGVFVDITQEVCPVLSEAGMVTASVWADVDGDGQQELIIAGDWMPIRVFKADGGKLKEVTHSMGLENDHGMWKSLAVADMDGDGDLDIAAGNLGTNNPYHVSAATPMRLFGKDFEGNGRINFVLCYYLPDDAGKNTLQLGMSLGQLTRQMPSFKKRYLKNAAFAKADLSELFPDTKLKDAIQLNCNELHTCWYENQGNGSFRKHILPAEAQFAPVNAILVHDLDGDGNPDLLLAGNEYQAEVMNGRYDASYGLFLKGNGGRDFLPVAHINDGIFIKGDVKDMKLMKDRKGNDLILVGINDGRMRIFGRR
ncbi:VCBS repeat-containing protein [Flavitalea sp. BT771]|uniref:VCBS repeat-containing protein n=1 Tax=Flavitalea sp. BT771 TaxID=3063329 RepID=UPI0026E2A85E|nr:VCBS repeat-containing protein [Flavitalea sp. BT771]MDO6434899.1 VCBS repeat-containing protein [Flavitalea sp. BT771]MDV6223799.1 VCBS repeat-containing protein [Flavitalea sp. BT771]